MSRRGVQFMAAVALLAVYLPLLVLMVWSFNASRTGATWSGFTLDWYRRLAARTDLLTAFRTSLIVATASTAIATVLGLGAAMALDRGPRIWRRAGDAVLTASIVLPEVVAGISLLILFSSIGIRLGLGTVIIAHVTFALPFTILVISSRLRGMDRTLEEAALTLGADDLTAFCRVTLPMLMPGVVAAALLAFTLSFDDFVITFFTAGPGTTTLPLLVYGMVRRTVEPTVNALSTLMVVGTGVLLLASGQAMRRET